MSNSLHFDGRLQDLRGRLDSLKNAISELQQRCDELQSQLLPPSAPPLVSIVLVAYNQQRFIGECLASVLAQRYAPLDIIVLDDASPDATAAAIADELTKHPERSDVRFIRNERNLGMFGNPEKGLSLARGEFVIICDGDDVMLPDMVEKMVAVWRRENVSLVTGNVTFIDEDSNELNRFWRDPTQPADATPETLARTGNNALCFGVAIGFERALYEQFGYPPEYLTAEDIMLPFYACLAKGGRFIPEPLMKYRIHSGNGGLGRAKERQTTPVGQCLVQAEIYFAELAHSVLMATILDRASAADPARAELAARLKPLVEAAILDKSKLLVDMRIEMGQLGVALPLASHPLARV